MFQTKPVLFFLLKSFLVFGLLAAPVKFYDEIYGDFYRGTCKLFFSQFHETGIALFEKTKVVFHTQMSIGNSSRLNSEGTIDTSISTFNTRYRGYLPTILFLALAIASPLSWKRKVISVFTGVMLLTGIFMFKQWIHILHVCLQITWLKLDQFTRWQQKTIEFLYYNFVNYNGSSLIFAIAVWLLVSFRKNDLEIMKR